MIRRIAGVYRYVLPLFPPRAPVTIAVDGRPVASYVAPYIAGGRVFAPADPLVVRLADRVWREGAMLVIQRGRRLVRVYVGASDRSPLDTAYIPAGPVLRSLDFEVRYSSKERRLVVRSSQRAAVASPGPLLREFGPAPRSDVFTPEPRATPRPVWTGEPLPRRTPLQAPPPSRTQLHSATAPKS